MLEDRLLLSSNSLLLNLLIPFKYSSLKNIDVSKYGRFKLIIHKIIYQKYLNLLRCPALSFKALPASFFLVFQCNQIALSHVGSSKGRGNHLCSSNFIKF
jgi:hypothetical protein